MGAFAFQDPPRLLVRPFVCVPVALVLNPERTGPRCGGCQGHARPICPQRTRRTADQPRSAARLGSARLGSVQLGSARLGPARSRRPPRRSPPARAPPGGGAGRRELRLCHGTGSARGHGPAPRGRKAHMAGRAPPPFSHWLSGARRTGFPLLIG